MIVELLRDKIDFFNNTLCCEAMPTFTAIALDRLLEPRTPKSMENPSNLKLERIITSSSSSSSSSSSMTTTTEKKINRAQASPSLYTTPEATPLPDSPSSFPPSPYIINHKRRGPRLLKSFSHDDVSIRHQSTEVEVEKNGSNSNREVVDSIGEFSLTASVPNHYEEVGSNVFDDGGLGDTENSTKTVAVNLETDNEGDDFFDPQESMSVTSSIEIEDNRGIEPSPKLTTPTGEFFDAYEELSSDGGRQSSLPDVEAELREIRLSLLMEIERRKQAEEALDNMEREWLRLRQRLSLVGLSLPAPPEDGNLDFDLAEELCQQVHLARVVSNSVGRGAAKAEIEMKMDSQIEAKNFEIARILDRLHYYEAVNHEMTQRNQEAVEMARCHRQRRKRRQRWVWSSIGVAIALGTAALAWSYLPTTKGSSPTNPSHAPDGDGADKP